MSTKNSSSSLQDNRDGLFETLRGLDPRLRFTIGLFSCAVVAYYVPSILIALTGVWVNNLIMMLPLLICATVLVVQNLIGNKVGKGLLVAAVFAMVVDSTEAYFIVRTGRSFALHVCWMLFFLPTAAFLLNAWLLGRYKAATGLA